AGPRDTNPFIHIPIGLAFIMRFKTIDWAYETAPQPNLDGRRLYWPRGRTLGGSSSINAMVYIRGVPADYDGWLAHGASGWGWSSVLPYFKKAQHQERGADAWHGTGGPLSVCDLRHSSAMSRAFAQSGAELQIPANPDFNGERQEGLGLYQVTQRNGQRCSTAAAYLGDAQSRSNLAILTGSIAQQVLFQDRRATGVRVLRGSGPQTVHARRQVILSGGAINSPQLLMLSGIGPGQHLQDLGIPVVCHLPGVGQNLQDHLDVIIHGRNRSLVGYGVTPSMAPRSIWGLIAYGLKRRGVMTSNVAEAGGFVRLNPSAAGSELQFHFLPARMKDHGRQTVLGYGYSLHVCCLQPRSRGEIRLASTDPLAAPVIDPRYLQHDDDAATMLAGVKLARRIIAAPPFARYRGREAAPGSKAQSDRDLLSFIRGTAETIYHPAGTCRMGGRSDTAAVVDPELKVRGVDGLRVVDASVMPVLIRGNTNAPTVMIAERAADLIRGRAGV
ncbi:MAG: GMC family oxidoreductase N-terminal domain-containing protein, partial [Alphaproteobacteria bacterium]|nr:GMC family oxidoreductase N-terminal domain-containing protein [Alphaproteobacteria bacterium]